MTISDEIEPLSVKQMKLARERQESLAKPPKSLGLLEDISVRMAGITGEVMSNPEKACVIVYCSDNGVVAEGVASAPASVTAAQTMNFTRRRTGVGALAESFGDELLIVDMGVKEEIPEFFYDDSRVPFRDTHKIVDRKMRRGTWNIAKGPAMTEEEVLQCIGTGIEMADAAKLHGYDLIGIGEMGIGNTTTSAAIIAGLTGEKASAVTGRGGGVNDEGFQRKVEIADSAVARWRASETAEEIETGAALRLLAEAGGFDICAMAGGFIGAAKNRLPVVIDGYISAAAALVAAKIAPASASYMFPSHRSAEPGYSIAIKAIEEIRKAYEDKEGIHHDDFYGDDFRPMLDLGMRLGEGSGCPIAFRIIRAACHVMRNMATFDEAEINDDYLEEVRKGGCF
ncbi:MAG: nicotinate-nucleotide--dimethylbenzimidazole phosphoribosyltransferase [Firmicutes bacterium]|nr:nicotinate-nucleotide--dimethylbenzimidazole phosphoribosyltransferase [Bacillota bacterium]